MAQLKIIGGREIGRTITLDHEIFIGREEGNELRLLDETSSRRHAKIQWLDDRTVLFDLDSNNGTFVNGERVRQRLLSDGDRVTIGKTTLLFEEEGLRRTLTVAIREEEGVHVESTLAPDAQVEPSKDYARLRKLYDIAALLSATLDISTLVEGVAGTLRESLDADVVVIVDADDEPMARAWSGARTQVAISRAVLERARRDRQALLVACAAQDRDLGQRESVVGERIESILCAPLVRGERWLGVLYVDVRQSGRRFTHDDLAFLTAVAQQAAMAIENARKYSVAQSRVVELSAQVAGPSRIVGSDARVVEAVTLAERAAQTDATVLILGESGTGKELFARLVHDRGRRSAGPFVAINCAAITETLLESELFGHERGAFTGAVRTQPGKVETAEGGTLFLDEIGELSGSIQAKLLRFLQDRTFYRVGGTRPRGVDARIVAATNRDLSRALKEGQFREDLFYRLSVVTLRIPPLRERVGDIPVLAKHLLQRACQRLKKDVHEIAPEAMTAIAAYAWPGNVRELENVVERAIILSDGVRLERTALPAEVCFPSPSAGENPVNLEAMEKVCIQRALQKTGGKKGEAAQLLGISWPTLNKKLRDYGLESA